MSDDAEPPKDPRSSLWAALAKFIEKLPVARLTRAQTLALSMFLLAVISFIVLVITTRDPITNILAFALMLAFGSYVLWMLVGRIGKDQ